MAKDEKRLGGDNVIPMRATPKIGRPCVKNPGEYAARIRQSRIAAGLNQSQLASIVGVTSNSVTNWESGSRRPDIDILKKICIALKVSADELLGIAQFDMRPSEHEKNFLSCYRALSRHDRLLLDSLINKMHEDSFEEFRRTFKNRFLHRAVNPLRVCAGTGVDLSDGGAMGKVLMRNTDETYASDEVITITGDSMEPAYHDGDRILVEHTDSVAPGEVGIFVIAGEGVIKVYQPDGLYPLNPAYQVLRPSDDDDARCVGRVIGVLTDDLLPTKDEQIMIDEINAERRK